jgi:hypothetical protein
MNVLFGRIFFGKDFFKNDIEELLEHLCGLFSYVLEENMPETLSFSKKH